MAVKGLNVFQKRLEVLKIRNMDHNQTNEKLISTQLYTQNNFFSGG